LNGGYKTIIQLDESAGYFNNFLSSFSHQNTSHTSNNSSTAAAAVSATVTTGAGGASAAAQEVQTPSQTPLFSSFIINNLHPLTPSQISNYQAAQMLPYHYSEYDHIFVCNLCNCTYDSLRSIKAHLWKHSGHHELSYPINNRSKYRFILFFHSYNN
jgi:hypothetical protein